MSSVASTALAPQASGCANQNFAKYPTEDVFCAFDGRQGIPNGYKDHFKECCNDAPVDEWANGCALYCLAAGQNVTTLNICLQEAGVEARLLFCSGDGNATATSTGDLSTTRPSATRGSNDPSGTAGPQESTGAAVPVTVPQGISKAGLGMAVIVAISAFAGALL